MTAKRPLSRLAAGATRGLEAVLGLGLIAMVLINVVNAVGRYGGLPTLVGADELLIFGMIWLVMIGAILTLRRRDHLAIDLLAVRLTGRAQGLVLVVCDLATALVSGFVAWHSLDFVERVASFGSRSMGLGLPMVIPHAAITLGFAGMAVVALILLAEDLAALRAGRPAHGKVAPR